MSIFTKIVCFRGSAPDPAGGASDAPPDPLVEFVRRLALQTGSCAGHCQSTTCENQILISENIGCLFSVRLVFYNNT